jgi:hypothetical protein
MDRLQSTLLLVMIIKNIRKSPESATHASEERQGAGLLQAITEVMFPRGRGICATFTILGHIS